MSLQRAWCLAAVTVVCAAIPRALRGQSVSPLPLRSGEVVVDVRATKVNDFDTRVSVARAEFTGTDLANVTGFFEVRVAEMRTGIGRRDRHLRNTLHADSLPLVRFDLVGVDAQGSHGDSLPVVFQGRLTLHGVTKTIRVPGIVIRRLTAIEVVVSRFALDMREYNIAPPSRFAGAIRVQPDVHVNARLVFGN